MLIGDRVRLKETTDIRSSVFAEYAGQEGKVIDRSGCSVRVAFGKPENHFGDYIDVGIWRLELVSQTSS
jgi:hypothetical protein